MSKASESGEVELLPEGESADDVDLASVDWLKRNAAPVDIDSVRGGESVAWERGKGAAGKAAVDVRAATGAAIVRLPDGDPHATILVEAAGDETGPFAGACDCEGWRYHEGPCAHLVTRAVRNVLRSGEVPTDVDLYEELKNAGGPVVDDVQVDDQEGDAGFEDVGGLEQQAKAAESGENSPEEAGSEASSPTPDGGETGSQTTEIVESDANTDRMPHTAGDPFASELSTNVPERFVMEIGGEPYIRRAGYARIARDANLRVSVDAVTAAEDTEFQHARYHAVVRDADGEVLGEDFGTAHLSGEDLEGAEYQLDELASTRAVRRALEWATGAGSTLRRGGE